MSDLIDVGTTQVPQPLSPNEAHSYAESLAAAGLPAEQIREQLKARGADPDKAITPAQEASWQLQSLKNDPVFAAKVNAGDVEANRLLTSLNAKIALAKPYSPVPEAAKPSDYTFDLQRLDGNTELQQRFQSETSQWAAEMKLPPAVASACVEGVMDFTERTQFMGQDARDNYGRDEEARLRSVLSNHNANPDAVLKEAQDVIKKHSGRTLDIAAVARTSGMAVAYELVSHARALAFAASRRS